MLGRFSRLIPLVALGGSAAMGYTPPAGYTKTGTSFTATAFAIAPDGRVAVGADSFSGGASIKLYSSFGAIGGTPLATFSDPTWKYVAGIEFAGTSTLVFGENGDRDTVFKADLSTNAVAALAPDGSVPNMGDLTVQGAFAYAVAANGANRNDLIRVVWDDRLGMPIGPTTMIHNFGEGFGGGVLVDSAGNFLLTDSNGFGVPGSIRRYDGSGNALESISLAPGGGSGAVDLVFDAEGDLIVSTGATLTQVKFAGGQSAVTPFGTVGGWQFPTFLAYEGQGFEPYSGNGTLYVSGFTDEPGVFGIAPAVPEPAGAVSMVVVMGGLLARRRRGGVR